jgi:hypothetical protein
MDHVVRRPMPHCLPRPLPRHPRAEPPRKRGQPHWDTNTPFAIVEKLTAT